MSATVRVVGKLAQVDGYEWFSPDKGLQELLNAMLSPLGPSGSDPNPDYHAAEAAVKLLGGEIIDFESTEYVEGVVY